MFNHILVAVDGSDCSEKALDMAVRLAKEQGARCTACIVVDVVRSASSMTFATEDLVNEWIATLNDEARHIENTAIAKYADSGVAIETKVLEGYPPTALLDAAKNEGADLVVMGSHGRTGLKRLWLWQRLPNQSVQAATLPVLIVR